MNVLDSPLEALAINYVRFGVFAVVNNLWTWVAVVTAALSFWRMRAIATTTVPGCSTSSSIPDADPPFERDAAGSNGCQSTSVVKDEKPGNYPTLRSKEANHGATKGRFTVYYDECDIIDDNCWQEAAKICDDTNFQCGLEWLSCSNRVLRMRNVDDMGWYRHQNLAILDGSVVRLWDDSRVIRH